MRLMIKQMNIVLVLLSILALVTLNGCSHSFNTAPISKTDFYFDTVITITLYDETQSALLDDCMQLCDDYENIFSRTISDSDISKLNQANGESVTVSEETIDIMNDALHYNKISEGAFDVTIGAVSSLWNFTGFDLSKNPISDGNITADSSRKPPTKEMIAKRIQHVNSDNIHIDGQTITLAEAGAKIDLGGIAKGYIADGLKEYLINNGVRHAIIDLGGNILTIGDKPDGTPYNIGIKKPFDPKGSVIVSVPVSDCSVVTSGTYERYFDYEGKRYHHILSPFTGYPTDSDLNSVTILSKDSVTGDALSTTCLILGLEDGMKLIESLSDVEALFITEDNELISSSGFPTNQ